MTESNGDEQRLNRPTATRYSTVQSWNLVSFGIAGGRISKKSVAQLLGIAEIS